MLTGGSDTAQAETRAVAAWALDQILHLLHPVMPFVTEELFQQLDDRAGALLIRDPWPTFDASWIDADADAEIDWVVRLITLVRGIRAEMNVPPGARLPLLLRDADVPTAERLDRYRDLILALARLQSAEVTTAGVPKGAVQDVLDGATVILQVADVIDIGAEQARLAKEIGKLDGEIARVDRKLANPGFLAKAPAELVETEREKREEAVLAKARLQDAARRLAAL